jgi:hypothetical protein
MTVVKCIPEGYLPFVKFVEEFLSAAFGAAQLSYRNLSYLDNRVIKSRELNIPLCQFVLTQGNYELKLIPLQSLLYEPLLFIEVNMDGHKNSRLLPLRTMAQILENEKGGEQLLKLINELLIKMMSSNLVDLLVIVE